MGLSGLSVYRRCEWRFSTSVARCGGGRPYVGRTDGRAGAAPTREADVDARPLGTCVRLRGRLSSRIHTGSWASARTTLNIVSVPLLLWPLNIPTRRVPVGGRVPSPLADRAEFVGFPDPGDFESPVMRVVPIGVRDDRQYGFWERVTRLHPFFGFNSRGDSG